MLSIDTGANIRNVEHDICATVAEQRMRNDAEALWTKTRKNNRKEIRTPWQQQKMCLFFFVPVSVAPHAKVTRQPSLTATKQKQKQSITKRDRRKDEKHEIMRELSQVAPRTDPHSQLCRLQPQLKQQKSRWRGAVPCRCPRSTLWQA